MLNGVLSLGDIRDVEKLCDRIATQALGHHLPRHASREESLVDGRRTGLSSNSISPLEREELVAYLIAQVWELWLRYDQADDGRGRSTFSGYAVPQLRMRVLDWWRRKLGRQRPGRDAKDNPGEWGVLGIEALDDGELERSLSSGGGDSPLDRVASLDGLFDA